MASAWLSRCRQSTVFFCVGPCSSHLCFLVVESAVDPPVAADCTLLRWTSVNVSLTRWKLLRLSPRDNTGNNYSGDARNWCEEEEDTAPAFASFTFSIPPLSSFLWTGPSPPSPTQATNPVQLVCGSIENLQCFSVILWTSLSELAAICYDFV